MAAGRPGRGPRAANNADVDWINALHPDHVGTLALPPRLAAELAVAIAEALPEEFLARNAAAGSPLNLLRAEHRREHLDEIEAALG